MKAAFIEQTGGVERIQLGELPKPELGPTDVLVEFVASEVNHVDLFVRSGAYQTHTPFPFVIGRDIVGTVKEVGSGVASFKEGDWVWANSLGHDGRQGAWSEFVVVASDRLYPLPAQVIATDAAAALHAGATAHIGLVREAGLQAGETILIEGAGGAVGSAVVQMAHDMGAKVIATASEKDAHWCAASGADAVFDYHDEQLYQKIAQAAPEGIDVWWDASGHNHFIEVLPLMAMHGRIVLMAGLQGSQPEVPVGQLYTKEITVHGFAISNASSQDLARAAKHVNRLLAQGKLKIRIGQTLVLDDAQAAQQLVADGQVKGRVVVVAELANMQLFDWDNAESGMQNQLKP